MWPVEYGLADIAHVRQRHPTHVNFSGIQRTLNLNPRFVSGKGHPMMLRAMSAWPCHVVPHLSTRWKRRWVRVGLVGLKKEHANIEVLVGGGFNSWGVSRYHAVGGFNAGMPPRVPASW